MDSQELRNLSEAYLEVYSEIDEATAMAKRGLNEPAIRQQIAKNTGGGQAADRATALENKPTYGQSGVNPAARQKLARAQRGDFRKTTSSSPGLHGYAHKSDDPEVKAKQAARGAQRSALTPNEKKQLNREEYTIILSHLIDEGYADTPEAAEVIMTNMSEDWLENILEEIEQIDEISANLALSASKKASQTAGVLAGLSGGDPKVKQKAINKAKQAQRLYDAQARKRMEPKIKRVTIQKEDLDLYDIILSHLIDEGYADTPEEAQVIMVNMSEEWREEILDESRGGEASPGTPKSFHQVSRGVKQTKGEKTSYDKEGNMKRKYLTMQLKKRKQAPYND